MEDRKTVRDVQRDIDSVGDDAWGFGALFAVVFACFVVLGVVIFLFGDDAATQSAANNPPPRTERMLKAPLPPAEPSTVGQGGSQ